MTAGRIIQNAIGERNGTISCHFAEQEHYFKRQPLTLGLD